MAAADDKETRTMVAMVTGDLERMPLIVLHRDETYWAMFDLTLWKFITASPLFLEEVLASGPSTRIYGSLDQSPWTFLFLVVSEEEEEEQEEDDQEKRKKKKIIAYHKRGSFRAEVSQSSLTERNHRFLHEIWSVRREQSEALVKFRSLLEQSKGKEEEEQEVDVTTRKRSSSVCSSSHPNSSSSSHSLEAAASVSASAPALPPPKKQRSKRSSTST